MIVDEQDSPTEILINVSRVNPTKPSERLPEPLAKTKRKLGLRTVQRWLTRSKRANTYKSLMLKVINARISKHFS